MIHLTSVLLTLLVGVSTMLQYQAMIRPALLRRTQSRAVAVMGMSHHRYYREVGLLRCFSSNSDLTGYQKKQFNMLNNPPDHHRGNLMTRYGKLSLEDDEEDDDDRPITYEVGQPVTVLITSFGYLGASVDVDGGETSGLILQRELTILRTMLQGQDVSIGDQLGAYVTRVREDGKVDISVRPVGRSRVEAVKEILLSALNEASTQSLPIGDKSSAEKISETFAGLSKSDFKRAVGALYREGKVVPGEYSIALTNEEQKKEYEAKADAIKMKKAPPGTALSTVFLSKIPLEVTAEQLEKWLLLPVAEKAETSTTPIPTPSGPDAPTKVNLIADLDNKSRGFAFVVYKDEETARRVARRLKGQQLNDASLIVSVVATRKTSSTGSEDGEEGGIPDKRQRKLNYVKWFGKGSGRANNDGGAGAGAGAGVETGEGDAIAELLAEGRSDRRPSARSYNGPLKTQPTRNDYSYNRDRGDVAGSSERPRQRPFLGTQRSQSQQQPWRSAAAAGTSTGRNGNSKREGSAPETESANNADWKRSTSSWGGR